MRLRVHLPWITSFPAQRKLRAQSISALADSDCETLIDQVNRFDSEIRNALRSSSTAVSAALIVLAFGASLSKDGSSRDIGLLVLFPLLGLVVTLHAQSSADVASMAEVRDRLANIVNRRKSYPLLTVRVISDVRRFAPGTVVINLVISVGVVVAAITILRFAWFKKPSYLPFGASSYFWTMLVLIILSCTAVLVAYFDVNRSRSATLNHLDDIFGCDSRPDNVMHETHNACQDPSTPKLAECPFRQDLDSPSPSQEESPSKP